MGRHRKNYGYPGGKPLSLGSLLGFLALSGYLLLPLVCYFHLTIFSSLASQEAPEDGVLIIWGNPEKPRRQVHDNTCPICRSFKTSHCYALSHWWQTPECASLAQPFCLGNAHRQVATSTLSVSGPRAPPRFV
jgi:hypothetical protein